MIANILLIGVGLIVALGGAILLDRERYNRQPRRQFCMALVSGVAVVALAATGII